MVRFYLFDLSLISLNM